MKRTWCFIVLFILLMPVPAAQSEWIAISKSLQELNIQSLAADPKNPSILISTSERHVYKSKDGGASWKQVMSVRGTENRVWAIHFDETKPGRVYLATEKGIYLSENSGDKWEIFFKEIDPNKSRVYAVCAFSEKVLAGTADGLFVIGTDGKDYQRAEHLPRTAVRSLIKADLFLFALTDQGVYKSPDARTWELVYNEVRPETASSLEQFDIEEISTRPVLSGLAYASGARKLFYGAREGILEVSDDGQNWNSLKGQPFKKVHSLAAGATTFFAATDTGIYRWDSQVRRFEELYLGLESKEVSSLYYSFAGDYLLAGTKAGVFKYAHPEFGISTPLPVQNAPLSADLFKQFGNEPTISEVQRAAIRYAEVQPDKIEAWRKAASRKAYLPTLSFSRSINQDENVDIDRGGTGDPDRFISGPMENSYDWSVSMNWNLGEVIWNDDQTSIDTRSRLLVELRDDILSKVTHLYYERRRLQIDAALSPKKDFPLEIENIIKLQELTAGIDALTGGYFSQKLKEAGNI